MRTKDFTRDSVRLGFCSQSKSVDNWLSATTQFVNENKSQKLVQKRLQILLSISWTHNLLSHFALDAKVIIIWSQLIN